MVVDTGENPICLCELSFMNIGVENRGPQLSIGVPGVVTQVAGCSTHGIPSSLFACQAQLKRVFLEHPTTASVGGIYKVSGSWSVLCEGKRGCLELRESTEGTQDSLFFWKAKGSSVYPTDAAALVMNRRLIEICLASAEPESNPPSFSSASLGPKPAEYLCLGVVLSICEPYTQTPTGKSTETTKSGMFSLCRWEKEMGRKKMYLETGWGKATGLI